MSEEEFDILITNALKKYGCDYIDVSKLDYTPHKFSPEFESKMDILLGRSQRKIHIAPKRLFTMIIAALIAACIAAMSVGAIRQAFISFIADIFDTHTDIRSVKDTEAPLDFSDKYEITVDLPEFELVETSEDIFDIMYIFKNENCTIKFYQSIKMYYDISVNTEGYEMETVYINEFEGIYVDMYNQNGKIIIWDNGDYIFEILVTYNTEYSFSKNELIEIAESVQKVEN